jgi:hypothetical protein
LYRDALGNSKETEQVDRLRETSGRLLRQSPDYQRLLGDLGAAPSPQ